MSIKRNAKFDKVIAARARREAARAATEALTADTPDRVVTATLRRAQRAEAAYDKALKTIWGREIDAFCHYSLALKREAQVA